MRASSTILAAAAVILAAGSAASAAPGAAAGFRPLMPAPRSAALWRGPERRPVERDRRLDRRGFGTELGELGAVGPMQAETPIGEAEAAPQAEIFSSPASDWACAAADSSGPRIIEIGKRSAARPGRLPVVVTGDFSP